MDDQSLNREIESALNVDPSPEFLAKVRTRIAAEPAPSRWRLAWVVVPVAASVFAAVAFLPSAVDAPVLRPRVDRADLPPQPEAPASLTDARSTREVRHAERPTTEQDGTTFPEVIVSADQQRAFQVLLGLIRKGQIPEMPVDEPVEAIDETPAIEIAPIALEDLAVVAVASREGEERP